jgi:putative ABC transport system substrate-binding protein
VRGATEIEHTMETFAREGGAGLVVLPSGGAINDRDSIIALAARHRLPTVYPYSFFTTAGGLLSYGIDVDDLFRRAAGYVDRILKGEKPADLPVQAFPNEPKATFALGRMLLAGARSARF